MMKPKLLVLLFLANTFFLTSQHNNSLITEDFNNDGIADTLKCIYDIGSNFGGSTCKITDGKTNKSYSMSNYGCFCSIKKHIVVDKQLQYFRNQHFLYQLKKQVLPAFRATPDQSLLWIINSGLNTKKIADNADFDLIFNPKATWRTGEPELPSTYYVEMNAEAISKIVDTKKNSYQRNTTPNKKDYLVYFGDTHHSSDSLKNPKFTSVLRNKDYEILKTKHGVLAKKDKAYKWLFVTDLDINDSPGKLRWPSIDEVILSGQYIIIKQNVQPRSEYNLYIINVESGAGGRLKIDFDVLEEQEIDITALTSEERFSIVENAIVIGKGKAYLKFPLTEIKEKLNQLLNEK